MNPNRSLKMLYDCDSTPQMNCDSLQRITLQPNRNKHRKTDYGFGRTSFR